MAETSPQIVLNGIAIWWITWTCVWTTCLMAGIAYLITKRHVPSVKIRGLTLTIASICMLHVYWILCQVGWIIGRFLPEMTEFWVMSLYLPAGLAAFQAANMRLLYIARSQERYAKSIIHDEMDEKSTPPPPQSWSKRILSRIRHMDRLQRLYLYIGFGMALQICVTIFIFCISRKFHPTWGIPGTEAPEDPAKRGPALGRGWEWIPSIGWQVFWTWICAPYILWKTRNIRDTHGWRLQTACCCIAGLPAAPLWLTALYAPAMAPINAYWIPPQWICLSILVMEIFTIFLPCYIAFRHQNLHKDTLNTIHEWETKHQSASVSTMCTADDATLIGTRNSIKHPRLSLTEMHQLASPAEPNAPVRPITVYSLESLEQCLRLNPEPLQRFAALKDFSGENITFLTSVADFKQRASQFQATSHPRPPNRYHADNATPRRPLDDTTTRHLFNAALRIYATSVSLDLAIFPINLSSREYKALEAVFDSAAQTLYGRRHSSDSQESNASTLFERWIGGGGGLETGSATGDAARNVDLESRVTRAGGVAAHEQPCRLGKEARGEPRNQAQAQDNYVGYEGPPVRKVYYYGPIPETFTSEIFDQAEQSIKHLVLQNTWAKFVKSGVLEEERREGALRRLARGFGGFGGQQRPTVVRTWFGERWEGGSRWGLGWLRVW